MESSLYNRHFLRLRILCEDLINAIDEEDEEQQSGLIDYMDSLLNDINEAHGDVDKCLKDMSITMQDLEKEPWQG